MRRASLRHAALPSQVLAVWTRSIRSERNDLRLLDSVVYFIVHGSSLLHCSWFIVQPPGFPVSRPARPAAVATYLDAWKSHRAAGICDLDARCVPLATHLNLLGPRMRERGPDDREVGSSLPLCGKEMHQANQGVGGHFCRPLPSRGLRATPSLSSHILHTLDSFHMKEKSLMP